MVSVHFGLMLMLVFLKDQSGPLLFLIYINDLSDGLKSECKLVADDTSLFSVIDDINTSASDLNDDLEKIGNWAFKWKMNFNSDPNEEAQEIIFSRKKRLLHCIQLYTLIINQLNQHKYTNILG